MKTVYVCIGSACHVKGSYPVIAELTRLQDKTPPEHAYEIKAVFCLGHCTRAVSVRIDDGPVQTVSPSTVTEFHRSVLCADRS
ncbi:MAG: NAD(P)H-dependent oxidoreductase subunit E [Eubacteriales bacterium]|nr:NAD(P)H-dependent oxidoreductase subunit E [Eubacteriales bacterium]